MNWLVRHHEAILLWICAVMLEACSTTFYHAPAAGVVMKAATIIFIIAGVIVMQKEGEEYDD